MWPLSLKICGGWGDDEDQDQVQNQDHVFSALHNVLFGQYVFLPTEQAETYLKIYVLIYH